MSYRICNKKMWMCSIFFIKYVEFVPIIISKNDYLIIFLVPIISPGECSIKTNGLSLIIFVKFFKIKIPIKTIGRDV